MSLVQNNSYFLRRKTMKKFLSLILAMLMILSCVALTACSPEEPETETPEFATMVEGRLTIGMEASYPPFEYKATDGEFVGFDVDLAKLIGDYLGVEIQFVDTAFSTIFEGLGTNYDCVISAVTIDADRAKSMDFTTPYIDNYQLLLVKSDSTVEAVENFKDAKVSNIAVQKGTTSEALLTDAIEDGMEVTHLSYDTIVTCMEQLKNGEVEAVLLDSTVAAGYIAANPDMFKTIWAQSKDAEQFGIACELGDKDLVDALNWALAKAEEEGMIDLLYTKWFESTEDAE